MHHLEAVLVEFFDGVDVASVSTAARGALFGADGAAPIGPSGGGAEGGTESVLFGGRPLPTKPDKEAMSYWVERTDPAQPEERFLKRY